jgi:hypothetical protein
MAAVSEHADTEKQKPSVTSQIAVGVVVALLAGGTAPWWYEKLLGASAPPKEAPASNAVDSLAEHPAISRSVVVGRWEFEQVIGNASIRSSFDFLPDGTFSGYLATFVGGGGRKDQSRAFGISLRSLMTLSNLLWITASGRRKFQLEWRRNTNSSIVTIVKISIRILSRTEFGNV